MLDFEKMCLILISISRLKSKQLSNSLCEKHNEILNKITGVLESYPVIYEGISFLAVLEPFYACLQ